MHPHDVWKLGLAAGAVALAVPNAVAAQGWTHTPAGEVGYGITFTTAASLSCGTSIWGVFLPGGGCSASPGAITFFNDGATLTIAVSPVIGSTVVTPTGHSITLATITTTLGGEGKFTFPEVRNVNVPIMRIALRTDLSQPVAGAETAGWRYVRLADTQLNGHGRLDLTPTIPGPERRGWENILWQYEFPTLTAANETHYVTARVTLAPEPGTLALVGGGLLAMLGAAVRARRRDEASRAEG